MNVFVYGTLQQGLVAHDKLAERGARFLGRAELDGYALYNLGWYPGIIPDETERVLGEAYEIDEPTLQALDLYEGEGTLYRRCLADVRQQDGEVIKAYVYVYNQTVNPQNKVPMEQQPWRRGE